MYGQILFSHRFVGLSSLRLQVYRVPPVLLALGLVVFVEGLSAKRLGPLKGCREGFRGVYDGY